MMPGRPKQMAAKLTDLERLALELAKAVAQLIPAMYENREFRDPYPGKLAETDRRWLELRAVTAYAPCLLAGLGDGYREKAGQTEPGPVQEALSGGDNAWHEPKIVLTDQFVRRPPDAVRPVAPPTPSERPERRRTLDEILASRPPDVSDPDSTLSAPEKPWLAHDPE